jgi:hypothetical protein
LQFEPGPDRKRRAGFLPLLLLLMRSTLPIMGQGASIAARESDKNRWPNREVANVYEKA